MKKITCEDIDIDCTHVTEEETVIKLVQEIKKHIKENHHKLWDEKVKYMDDEEIEKFVSSAIKEK